MRRYSTSSHFYGSQWLLAYANFTTLLVGILAVLAVGSGTRSDHLAELASAFSAVLGGSEETEGSAFSAPLFDVQPSTAQEVMEGAVAMESNAVDDVLQRIEARLVSAQTRGNLREALSVYSTPQWVMVVVSSDAVFTPGDFTVRNSGQDILAYVARSLLGEAVLISISGHTDDQMATAEASWQLSSRRAASVARTLQREGIAPQQLTAQGFGSFQPRQPNDTPEQRAENRRLEILISRPTIE